MKLKMKLAGARILFLSDMHIPYHHQDNLPFLKAIKKKYRPDLIVSVGDLADFHGISFHKSDPDLDSPGKELAKLRKVCKELEMLFPDMFIVGSNHGDLPMRKAFDAGLPRELMATFNQIHDVGPGWRFVNDLTIADKAEVIYVAHGICKDGIKLSAQRGVHTVQGHYHTEYRVDYVSNPRSLLWAMQVGCSIDKEALAFAYNKLDLSRPIIGHGIVEDGLPRLLPMKLAEGGRWTGYVP